MNRILIWILLILWVLLGLWFFNKYMCGMSGPAAAAPIPAVINPCDTEWVIKDGSGFKIKSSDNIKFKKSSFSPYGITDNVNNAISEIADYLKGHSDRNVLIIGHYGEDENNTSILPDLGLARAGSIKRMLEKVGVPSSQIDIASEVSAEKCWSTKEITQNGVEKKVAILNNGIDVDFKEAVRNEDRLSSIKARLLGNPIVLHFATNADQVNLTGQQRQDFADLMYYMDRVDGAKLDIDGHTDNEGDRAYNINLSKERAEFAKDYLQRNGGISVSKMDVAGYGPDRPVASNATEDGKAQNRRVEVTLK